MTREKRTTTYFYNFVTTALILVNMGFFVAMFSFPPMSLPDNYQYYPDVGTNNTLLNKYSDGFIRAELQKDINEIQMRLQDQNTWFHYKFILVGGLFAAFWAVFQYIGKQGLSKGERYDSTAQLEITFRSPLMTITLATVCSLCLMIDLHIRGNAIVVNQIGLWIASHVEPLYLGNDAFRPHSFLAWETFLRRGGAMHTDVVNSITFFWPIHILTVSCFLLYLINARTAMVNHGGTRTTLELLSFLLVHFFLIVLAWTGHYVPPMFQQKLPLLGLQEGIFAALPYAGLALVLTIINGLFIIGKVRGTTIGKDYAALIIVPANTSRSTRI